MSLFTLLFGLLILIRENSSDSLNSYEYCVIGAGPAGLQLAYYLDFNQRNYVLFERNNNSGSFFNLYPRARKLISLNKRHTGELNEEFNLRHDWHSLLTEKEHPEDAKLKLKFAPYSTENFPHVSSLLKYLNDFSTKFNLNIKYDTNISNVKCNPIKDKRRDGRSKKKCSFSMEDQHNNKYSCK
jgi:protoporphyrinogen oxidase